MPLLRECAGPEEEVPEAEPEAWMVQGLVVE